MSGCVIPEKLVPPEFTRVPGDKEVRETQRSRFDCAVKGVPNPDVTWSVVIGFGKKTSKKALQNL